MKYEDEVMNAFLEYNDLHCINESERQEWAKTIFYASFAIRHHTKEVFLSLHEDLLKTFCKIVCLFKK